MERLVVHTCGCAVIPTLSKHQVVGGRKSEGEYRRHLDQHPRDQEIETTRSRVLMRDQYTCRYCGAQPEADRLVAEHVINGGPTTMENLVTACRSCNRKKSNKTVEEAGMTLLPEPVRIVPDNHAGRVGNVTVGNGITARKRDDEDDGFRSKVGLPAFMAPVKS
jgi:5-methylcytosine-specific restriction endonuclease McrA